MNLPNFKIVGVTAHFSESFKQKSIMAGMDQICPKPLYANVLNEILS